MLKVSCDYIVGISVVSNESVLSLQCWQFWKYPLLWVHVSHHLGRESTEGEHNSRNTRPVTEPYEKGQIYLLLIVLRRAALLPWQFWGVEFEYITGVYTTGLTRWRHCWLGILTNSDSSQIKGAKLSVHYGLTWCWAEQWFDAYFSFKMNILLAGKYRNHWGKFRSLDRLICFQSSSFFTNFFWNPVGQNIFTELA